MKSATLILKDGTTFEGKSFGAEINTAGEVVFNTSMVGYPESLTDPSYKGQILTFTYPLIGNYGIGGWCKDSNNIEKRFESKNLHIKGIIVNEYSKEYSHYDSNQTLDAWLKKNNIPGITGIDTRKLTQKIREHGTILGKIVIDEKNKVEFYNPDKEDLVDSVSPKKPKIYNQKGKKHIICIDCGMKNNILRMLINKDLKVTRVPWNYDFTQANLNFDGIFISNGPGNPALLKPLHEIIKKSLKLKKPIFGICLGIQIMAIAAGAQTYKMKYGHRGSNQPCQDIETKKCYITSQNHGFAIKEKSLPSDWKVWLKNLNDNTIEGIKHKKLPYFACQFHPEACPGPTDTNNFFDIFTKML